MLKLRRRSIARRSSLRTLLPLAVLALSCSHSGTTKVEASPQQPPAPGAANELDSPARLLATRLSPESDDAGAHVERIARSGDEQARAIAHRKIRRHYAWLSSKAWNDQATETVDAANEAAGLAVTRLQLEQQVEHWRAEHLRRARKLLYRLGDDSVIADALDDARNGDLIVSARRLALQFLRRDVRPPTEKQLAYLQAIEDQISRPAAGQVENAVQVVSNLRGSFRECYKTSLAANPNGSYSYKVLMRVGPDGVVAGVSTSLEGSETVEDPHLTSCIVDVAQAARFSPPEGGSAVVNLPLSFRPATAQTP